jgi:CBS domain-containing protein
MKVGNFCNRDVVITDRDTSILDAAKLMRHHHVGDIVVVENLSKDNIPIGIITDRDIVVELLAEEINLSQVTVGDAMGLDLYAVLVGIITLDDMIEVIAEQLSTLTLISGREHQIEVERRA